MADDIHPIFVVMQPGNRPHRPHAGSTYSVSAFRNEAAAQRSAKATGGDVVEFVPRGAISLDIMRAVWYAMAAWDQRGEEGADVEGFVARLERLVKDALV